MAAKKNEWRVSGRRYSTKPDPSSPTRTSYREEHINIPEQVSNLTMGDSPAKPLTRIKTNAIEDETFGKPIDINLAIHLIENGLAKANNIVRNKHTEDKFLKAFIDLSNGITFDKALVLKMLSQPNCEGLRAYACARSTDGEEASIVLVAVDACGFDLNYEPAGSHIAENNTDQSTQSLIIEYGFPPTSTSPKIFNANEEIDPAAILPNYVILKRAAEKAKSHGLI